MTAATIISLFTRTIAGIVCGYMMGVTLSNNRYNFKGLFRFYLTVIVTVAFVLVTAPKSLIVIGLALIAYLGFLFRTGAKPASVFIWPIIWLVGAGLYLIMRRKGTADESFFGTFVFLIVAVVAIVYPFVDDIQKFRDNMRAKTEKEENP